MTYPCGASGHTGLAAEREMTVQNVLVPVVLFLCITYVIKLLIDARMRILLLRAGGADGLLQSLLQHEEVQRRHAALRSGISLLALAGGFGVVQLLGWTDITPGAAAVLVGALGLGNLCYYGLTRHKG